MDMGTEELSPGGRSEALVREFEAARKRLESAGYRPGVDLEAPVIPGARHNEPAWAARAAEPLRFLFPAPRPERPRRDDSRQQLGAAVVSITAG